MIHAQPSRTALRVALRRASHQLFDAEPLVFRDPLAVRILPAAQWEELSRTPNKTKRPFSASLRAWMVTRARFAEDTLAKRHAEGFAAQYLVLGAGLDTFAYRNPYKDVQVFEVDHPATQAWKQECIASAKIAVPSTMHYVPVDFERDSLAEQLSNAGFDWQRPTVIAWLGVVPYLTPEAFRTTLSTLAQCASGSEIVFDYAWPRHMLGEEEQKQRDSMSRRVAQVGEPFQLFFSNEELAEELAGCGWKLCEALGGHDLNALYLSGRCDDFVLRGRSTRLARAEHA